MAGQADAGATDGRRGLGRLIGCTGVGPNRETMGAEIVAMRSRPDRIENLLTVLLVLVTALMALATFAGLGLFGG